MKYQAASPYAVVGAVVLTLLWVGYGLYTGNRSFTESAQQAQGLDWVAVDGDPTTGNQLFATHCASCHQESGHGLPGLAPSIRNRDFLALASDGFIHETIKRGRAGTAMIPRPDLTDETISHIIAFLRATPIANPVEVELDHDLVVTGDYGNGKRLYRTYCGSCHGNRGEGYSAGGSGPGIGLPGFINVASDDYIYQTIKRGRLGTPMMPFMGPEGLANLTREEVFDIIAFLKINSTVAMEAGAGAGGGIPDPSKGGTLFATNCAPCHQMGGTGKPGLAPSIRNRDFLAIASDAFITQTVVHGRPGTGMVPRPDLESAMPHITAYLRSLPVANPVQVTLNADYRATGDAAAGESKFKTYCASCHGPNGEGYSAGGSGPGIGLEGFLNLASDDYILQTTKQGRIGTAMMPFVGARGLANLEESDIEDIIVYLRSSE